VTGRAGVSGPRGTLTQRARVAVLRAASAGATRLPAGLAGAFSDVAGELWYRVTPARAATARANLHRVCENLAATGRGSPRARRAAADDRELERLVRAAYRHAVRTYVEMLRWRVIARDLGPLLTVEHPETVEPAFNDGAAVFATMHFGSLQVISAVLGELTAAPVTSPMETLADPELQRFLAETRAEVGLRIVPLAEARSELRAALRRGELVGIVADRDVAGGGIAVPLFGSPAPLPAGPAMLALEHDVPIHVAATRRVGGERFAGHLVTIRPADVVAGIEGRRARVEALMVAVARAFEHFISASPEQWWAVFYPIWPDLRPEPRVRAAAKDPR
jgi:lauroyl/myristoyl acyltransferase